MVGANKTTLRNLPRRQRAIVSARRFPAAATSQTGLRLLRPARFRHRDKRDALVAQSAIFCIPWRGPRGSQRGTLSAPSINLRVPSEMWRRVYHAGVRKCSRPASSPVWGSRKRIRIMGRHPRVSHGRHSGSIFHTSQSQLSPMVSCVSGSFRFKLILGGAFDPVAALALTRAQFGLDRSTARGCADRRGNQRQHSRMSKRSAQDPATIPP